MKRSVSQERNRGQIDVFDEIIVDNFAGGGGASTGIELASGRVVNIAINHDPDAILMHKTNHPYTEHIQASVWDVNPGDCVQGAARWIGVVLAGLQTFQQGKGSGPGRSKHTRPCLDCVEMGWNGQTACYHPRKRRGICDVGTGSEGTASQEAVREDVSAVEKSA